MGHLVSKDGIKMDPSKIAAVANLKRPTTKKELMGLLGLCSYYRRFVAHFNHIAAPLTQLLAHDRNVSEWSTKHDAAFATLRTALMSEPVLVYPDLTRPFEL